MARVSKSPTLATASVTPTAGLDFSGPATSIADEALRVALNVHYPPGSKKLRSRPGVTCVLQEANKLPAKVDVIRPYFNGTTTYMVAISDNDVYQITKSILEGAVASRVFSKVGDLTTGGKIGMAVMNAKLFIADPGSEHLRYWNGTTYGTISNSPHYPSVVLEARNRLWVNSTTDKDAITASKAEWSSTDFADAGYVSFRAGYGDGMSVVGLCQAPGGNDLLVHKVNPDGGAGQCRRISVAAADPTNWVVTDPIFNASAQNNPYATLQAFNDALFFSDDGLFNVAGVQQYGDLQVGNIGSKINPLMKRLGQVNVQELSYNEQLGCVFVLLKNTPDLYVFTPWNGAFTMWNFGTEQITSICTLGGKTYLGTAGGRIYKLNTDYDGSYSEGTDELVYGTSTFFTSSFRTKTFSFGGFDGRSQHAALLSISLSPGDGLLEAVDQYETASTIYEWTQGGGSLLVGGSFSRSNLVGGTASQNILVGSTTGGVDQRRGFGGPRSDAFAFQVTLSNGARSEFNYLSAQIRTNLGG